MNDEEPTCDIHTCSQCEFVDAEMWDIHHMENGHVGRTTWGNGVVVYWTPEKNNAV